MQQIAIPSFDPTADLAAASPATPGPRPARHDTSVTGIEFSSVLATSPHRPEVGSRPVDDTPDVAELSQAERIVLLCMALGIEVPPGVIAAFRRAGRKQFAADLKAYNRRIRDEHEASAIDAARQRDRLAVEMAARQGR